MIVEPFAEGDSVIHRLDPKLKIVFVIIFSVVVAVSGNFITLVSALLFAALIGWGIQQFNLLMARLMPQLPDWAAFVEWLLWPMFALVVLLLLVWCFRQACRLVRFAWKLRQS